MRWHKVECLRDSCTAEFTVADEYDERDCWRCGATHTAPWDGQQAETATDGGVPVADDRKGTKPVQEGSNATEATCTRCGTVYDTSRERSRKYLSGERCPSCGTVNTPDPQPAQVEEAGKQPLLEQAEAMISAADRATGEDGDVHFHFHQG